MLFRTPLLRRVCAVILVAVISTAPATNAFAAGEAAKLEQVRTELSEIRKRLAAARGEAKLIRAQAASLDRKIGELNRQIRTGEREISELESGIRSAEARIVELEEQHMRAAKASNERARRLYKAGPATFISRLFSARSIGELTRLTVWWQVTAELDGKVMIVATRLKADLDGERAEFLEFKSDLAEQKSWLEQRRALVVAARSDKAQALSALEKDIADDEAHIKSLERESRALTAALRAAMSRSSGEVSRSGFIWPLNGRVTSDYGYRYGGFHSGIDIDGETGNPVVASKMGSIVTINCGSGYGICTVIDHGGGVATLYAHMSRKAVSSGSVSRGQVIGYVGCTGSCSGSHLHFEVRVDGEPRNPRTFLP